MHLRLLVACYVCLGFGLFSPVRANAAALLIKTSPASVVQPFGSIVTLAAEVTAAAPATYVWRRDGVLIINGGRYSGAESPILTIADANSADNGNYSLTATNIFGTASTTPATVTVTQVYTDRDPTTVGLSSHVTIEKDSLWPFLDVEFGTVYAILHLPDGRTLLGSNGPISGAAGTVANSNLTIVYPDDRVSAAPPGIFGGALGLPISNTGIHRLVRQSDGKILVLGPFLSVGGISGPGRMHLVRLNADLTLDSSFRYLEDDLDPVDAVVDDWGRIYLACNVLNSGAHKGLIRLLPDGTLDDTFDLWTESASCLVRQPDGKILVGNPGSYGSRWGPATSGRCLRILPDGTVDPDFTDEFFNDCSLLTLDSRNRILICDPPKLNRFLPDGMVDPTFVHETIPDECHTMLSISDDRILIGGRFLKPSDGLLRFNASGSRDTNFDLGPGAGFGLLDWSLREDWQGYAGWGTGPLCLARDAKGRIWIGGSFYQFKNTPVSGILVLQGEAPTLAFTTVPEGQIRELGDTATFSAAAAGNNGFAFQWRKNGVPLTDNERINGSRTSSLSITGLVDSDAGSYTVIVTSPRESITSPVAPLVVAAAPTILHQPEPRVAPIGGTVVLTGSACGAQPLSYQWIQGSAPLTDGDLDGMIVAGSATPSLSLSGLTSAQAGEYRLRVTNALGQTETHPATLIVRHTPLEPSLLVPTTTADGAFETILRLADGSMLVGGDFSSVTVGGVVHQRGRLAHFYTDGTLDPDFTPVFDKRVRSLAQDSMGRILVGGDFTRVTFDTTATSRLYVARLTPALALDPTFDTSLVGPNSHSILALAPTDDDRVYVGGEGAVGATNLCRLDSSGTIDPNFTCDIPGNVNCLLREDGGMLYVGYGTKYPISGGIAKLAPTGIRQPFASPLDIFVKALLLSDGTLLVGSSTSLNRVSTSDGLPAGSSFPLPGSYDTAFARQSDGKVIYATTLGEFNRLDLAGAADATFGYAARLGETTTTFAVDASDRIWIAGTKRSSLNQATYSLRVLNGGDLESWGDVPPQPITFPAISDRVFNPADNTLALSATSGSALPPVTFAVTYGSATIIDSVLTVTGAGPVTVTATQAGDEHHRTASARQTFLVTKAPQAITFGTVANTTPTALPFALSAVTSAPGLAVRFQVSGPASISGDTLMLTGALGTVTVTAVQPGDDDYAAAMPVIRSFEVTANPGITAQEIAFAQPAAATYGNDPIPLSATASSGLPVAFELVSTAPAGIASLDEKTLTITGAGKVVIRAIQPGNGTFKPAAAVARTLTVNKACLTVRADNVSRLVGAANPTTFALTYTGFVNGDTEADLASTRPVAKTKATTKSAQGDYAITVSGGSDANYTFVAANPPGLLHVLGFGGTYEALLVDAALTPFGKLTLTVPNDAFSYSGTLTLASEGKTVSFKSLATNPLVPLSDASSASVGLPLTVGGTACEFDLILQEDGPLVGNVTGNGIAPGSLLNGSRVTVFAKGQAAPGAGANTLVLHPPSILFDGDQGPIPGGSGHATASIASSSGVLTLKGKLSDGQPLTASLKPTRLGETPSAYLLWANPYGTRTESFLAGRLALQEHPDQTRFPGRFYIPSEAGLLVWQKASLPESTSASKRDKTYRAGFGPLGVPVSLDPWLPPSTKAVTTNGVTIPAGTLAQRLGLADDTPPGVFALSYDTAELDLGESESLLPTAGTLASNGKLTVPGASATSWKITITPETGSFSGSFVLRDQVNPLPAKPTSRTVSFSGTLRQSPDDDPVIGTGFFLLPGFDKSAEQPSAEIRFSAPTP